MSSKKEEYNKEKEKAIKRNIKLDFNVVQFKKIFNQIDEFDINEYLEERLKERWFKILNNYLIQDLKSKEKYSYYNKIFKLIKKADQYIRENSSSNIFYIIENDNTLSDNEKAIYKYVNNISNGRNTSYPRMKVFGYLNLNNIKI